MEIKLRPSQNLILQYNGGSLGISAVPGSGKTFVLSALAAQLIASGRLDQDQEVLIVTLVNSAVDNFSARISSFTEARGLLPHLGYRVRTLHGLAHDIVREKPAAVGIEERFQIIDEREADFIRKESAHAWLRGNPDFIAANYLRSDLEDYQLKRARKDYLPDLITSLASAFIRSAKDRRLTPDNIRRMLDLAPAELPLVEMALQIYSDYQRALAYRGAVDFDDLIRLALDLLERDQEYLERLRYRFPYVLEDEAQDSSQLQEKILRLLAGAGGNWVRVGDPNQAIFETFTTANPRYLLQFIRKEARYSHELPESGRCQPSVIALANQLIEWVTNDHPNNIVRDALTPPHIVPTPPGDPQPNPEDFPAGIQFVNRKYNPEQEVVAVADSVAAWLPEHPDKTVAVLVPRNTRGTEVIDALKKRGIEPIEFLASTSSTRATAGALTILLQYLSDPQSATKLAKVYRVWRRDWRGSEDESQAMLKHVSGLIRKVGYVEDYLVPHAGKDWLSKLDDSETVEVLDELTAFRESVLRWQETTLLPIDQMILTLAQDIFTNPADLALAHKLALVLRQASNDHSEWRLPELAGELAVIAKNERRFLGFSKEDSGFKPEDHKGRVVVMTMHKAKGLEWDRVYLMSLNNYDFPSGMQGDSFISEKWFLRDELNLEAESLAQLDALELDDEFDWYEEGRASLQARNDFVRERLRLFYVGITRAKKELIMTWNSGRQGEATPALGFAALQGWWSSIQSRS